MISFDLNNKKNAKIKFQIVHGYLLLRKQHDLERENNKLKEELLRSKSPQVAQVDENRKKDEEYSAKPLKSINIA